MFRAKSLKRIITEGILASFVAVLSTVLPFSTALAATIQMEGAIYAKNVTQGTQYSRSGTSAAAGETVSFEIYYHNQEAPDSGLNANNVRIKATVPGDSATSHTVSAVIKADNSNQVNDSTSVTSTAATQLQFVPGSVTWRHNTGTNAAPNWVTESIGDGVVTDPNGAVVEQTEQPCNNFAATVAFQAKIVGQTPPPTTPPPTPTPPATPTKPQKSGSPAPTALVNTGPGDVAALFVAATIVGAWGYSRLIARRI